MNDLLKKLSPEKQHRLQELMRMVPEHVRGQIAVEPRKALTGIQVEKANRAKYYPSMGMVPNIGQIRALQCLAKPHESYKDYPYITVLSGGNGAGKTSAAAGILMPGICLGPEFVNREYCNWQYFYDIEELKQKRKLQVRIVCDAKDMGENGSFYEEIKKWMPTAQFSDKTGGFYQMVKIGDVTIDIKTHDMKKTSHAGPTLDILIFNEPPPQSVWDENVGRTRKGGRIFLFLTPLEQAAYLYNLVNDPTLPEGEVVMTQVSIWENCADVPGTRGILSRRDIERMIRQWERSRPDEVEARTTGSFQHLGGRVFKIYKEDVHVIDPFPLSRSHNLYFVCDPHESKPPFAIVVAVDAMNNCYIVAEYPQDRWDQIIGTDKQISHFCSDFDFLLSGKHEEFPYLDGTRVGFKIGDPNRFLCRSSITGQTLQQEYAKVGYDFDCQVTDSLDIGFSEIRGLLYYDSQRPLSATNAPHLYIFRTCKNTMAAFREFSKKRNQDGQWLQTYDETWKCPIDCVRYFAMKREPWQSNGGIVSSESDDYWAYRNGPALRRSSDEW